MSYLLKAGAARTLYDDTAKKAYQSSGPDVRPSVTFRTTAGADTFTFRYTGRAVAKKRIVSLGELENANIAHGKITVDLENHYSSDVTDVFDQDSTNVPQEIADLASEHAAAVKRAETQVVIDAIVNAAGYAGTVVHGSEGLTIAKIVGGLKFMRANDIEEPVTLWYTENQEADVLQLQQFTSADYARMMGMPAAMSGRVQDGHYGIARYLRIGTGRDEDGLPISATTRSCFLSVPSAVGLVVGFGGSVKTSIKETEHLHWRHTVYTRMAAKARDTLGLVKVECTE